MSVSSEKAFDLLPSFTEIYDKLDINTFRENLAKETEGKTNISKKLVGIDLFKYILKNSPKVKEEVFEIVSVFEEKTIEEVKEQSFMLTINTLRKIFTDTETTDFLGLAMQLDTPKA